MAPSICVNSSELEGTRSSHFVFTQIHLEAIANNGYLPIANPTFLITEVCFQTAVVQLQKTVFPESLKQEVIPNTVLAGEMEGREPQELEANPS